MAVSFGVHVGQTSACLAVERDGRCDVVANDAGDRVTPAVVGWSGEEILVGSAAVQMSSRRPGAIVKGSKYVLGLGVNDEKVQNTDNGRHARLITEENSEKLRYEVKHDEEASCKKVTVEKVHGQIYKYMHDIALSHASAEVDEKNTVVTVPLDFDANRRRLVAECAESAGFHVVQVISEPAAACLAYSLGQLDHNECYRCLVYRCGGASLTVSVVLVNAGMYSVVKSITKPTGGNDVTNVVIEHLAEEFKRKYKVDPRETKRGKQKLIVNSENIKHVLSTLDTANCYIESLYDGIDFSCNVTRARFDNEFGKLLSQFTTPIQEVLKEANLEASDIEKVVMCGGTSKIPRLQKSVGGMFPQAEMLCSISPDEVIAVGAASQSGLLPERLSLNETADKSGNVTVQSTTMDIVYQLKDSEKLEVLIPAQCPIPLRRSHHLTLSGESTSLSVSLSLKPIKGDTLTLLAQLKLAGVTKESKPSLSAHVHRDGSLHLALTDRTSGKCDQVTLACS